MDSKRRGTHKGISLITSIDFSMINLVESIIAIGVDVRHIPDIGSKRFIVSDRAVMEIPDSDKELDQRSEFEYDSTLVNSYLDTFERMWLSAADARERMVELKSNSVL